MSKKKLYEAVKARFDEIESVSFGGIFNDQFRQEERVRAHKWPIAYLDFSQLRWSAGIGTNTKVQQGDVEITLHIGFKTIDENPERFLDQIDEVYNKLEGFAPDGYFDPLRRTSEKQTSEFDNVFVWEITFRTTLKDEGAMNEGSTFTFADEMTITRDLKIDNDVVRSGKF